MKEIFGQKRILKILSKKLSKNQCNSKFFNKQTELFESPSFKQARNHSNLQIVTKIRQTFLSIIQNFPTKHHLLALQSFKTITYNTVKSALHCFILFHLQNLKKHTIFFCQKFTNTFFLLLNA